ncbi:MAG: SprT family zinc-dependent metalloprotease [Bacteroidota bacterium]
MEIKYKIVYSRRRSVSISMTPDKGVVVRVPYHMPAETIEKFVSDKEPWIRKHLNKYSEITRLNNKEYIDGEDLLYQGKLYRLKVNNSSHVCVNQHDDIIEAGTGGKQGITKALIDIWYRKRAAVFINERFREILARYSGYGFRPSRLAVRPLKSRWGSCTSKGKITISSELIKIDPLFTDHVIIHELCHLKYHNHSKDFYNLLEELEPGHKSIRKDLRKYITR